jgi:hypothetical protein
MMASKLVFLLILCCHAARASRFIGATVLGEVPICGPGEGSCEMGSCCSEGGFCGTTPEYCSGSQCQIDYSHTCDTL